jgi:hypothetical protein
MTIPIVASDVPRALSSLLKLCRIPKILENFACDRLAEAMEALICRNAASLKITKSWNLVLDILFLLTKHSTTVIFRVVSFLVLESGEISLENFEDSLKLVCAFVSDQQEIQLSLEALDLICALQNRVTQWSSEDGGEECQNLWMLLLQTFATFCEDSRGDVRDHSLVCLQRCLFRFESPNNYADWSVIFTQVQYIVHYIILHLRHHAGFVSVVGTHAQHISEGQSARRCRKEPTKSMVTREQDIRFSCCRHFRKPRLHRYLAPFDVVARKTILCRQDDSAQEPPSRPAFSSFGRCQKN